MIHIGPLKQQCLSFNADEWHVLLAIGAGISKLKGRRVTDSQTKLEGILRDHPSLRVEFLMRHRDPLDDLVYIESIAIKIDE